MSFFRELLENASATQRLKPAYYLLTTFLGFVGVTVGFGAWVLLGQAFVAAMGFGIDDPVTMSPTIVVMVLVMLALIPLCFYIGVVLVAGVVALAMSRVGSITRTEAFHYARVSRYPAHWYK